MFLLVEYFCKLHQSEMLPTSLQDLGTLYALTTSKITFTTFSNKVTLYLNANTLCSNIYEGGSKNLAITIFPFL